MASLTIHNLDAEVEKQLQLRAAAHSRSVDAEAHAILESGVKETSPGQTETIDEATLSRRRQGSQRPVA